MEFVKVESARRYLVLMRTAEEAGDESIFRDHTSSYLAASRSAIQYVDARIDEMPDGSAQKTWRAWREQALERRPLIARLKVIRDADIHHQPLFIWGNGEGRYVFHEFDEPALDLCEQHLKQVESLLDEARERGLLVRRELKAPSQLAKEYRQRQRAKARQTKTAVTSATARRRSP